MNHLIPFKSGIYKIICTVSGHFYIGSAINFTSRWWTHRRDLMANRHHCQPLQRAWNKYGENAFAFSRLLFCANADLIFYEQRAFDAMNPVYNCAARAGSCLGLKHGPESRAKMSAKAKARPPKPHEWHLRRVAALRGRKRPPEVSRKVAAALAARPQTPADLARLAMMRSRRGPVSVETRAKLSKALAGNKHTLGYKHTPETCAKMSAVRKGKPHSPEWNAKIAAAHIGRKHTPETCAKISIAKRNPSAETRLKLSLAKRGITLTAEHKAKIGAAFKGNRHNIGRKHSLETRAKVSAALLKRVRNPETFVKIAAKTRGQKRSLEQRLRMSAASNGRVPTAEARKNMSLAQLRRNHQRRATALQSGETVLHSPPLPLFDSVAPSVS